MGWIVMYVTTSGDHKVYTGKVHAYRHEAQREADNHRLSFVTSVYVTVAR